jgi:hypothetical protein
MFDGIVFVNEADCKRFENSRQLPWRRKNPKHCVVCSRIYDQEQQVWRRNGQEENTMIGSAGHEGIS